MQNFEMVRGTTHAVAITLTDGSGAVYTLAEGEVLRFGVKQTHNSSDYLIEKELTAADLYEGAYLLTLRPADTASLPCGRYCYDIGLESGADFFNIVPCSDFVLLHNITCKEGAQ